jgi:ElaB/YqjD/DUF883 family membrane-anchored ribosome-binding protein
MPAIDPVLTSARRSAKKVRSAADAATKTLEIGRRQAPAVLEEIQKLLERRSGQVQARATDAVDAAAEWFEPTRRRAAESLGDLVVVGRRGLSRPAGAAVAALGLGLLLGVLLSRGRR